MMLRCDPTVGLESQDSQAHSLSLAGSQLPQTLVLELDASGQVCEPKDESGSESAGTADLGNTQIVRPDVGGLRARSASSSQARRCRLAGRLRRFARPRVKACRVVRCATEVQLAEARGASGSRIVIRGVQTCGSVHSCPQCAAAIMTERAQEISAALSAHRRERCAMVTFTLRHSAGLPLSVLRRLLTEAYGFMKSGRAGAEWKTLLGYQGDVRACETTYGRSGWHPHVHAVWFLGHDVEREAMQKAMSERWQHSVAAVCKRWVNMAERLVDVDGKGSSTQRTAVRKQWGNRFLQEKLADGVREFAVLAKRILADPHCVLPSVERGVRVDPLRNGSEAVSGYLAKLGLELESITKEACGESRTSWQLAAAAAEGDFVAAVLWREYSRAMLGARQLVWSRGLRDRCGLREERPDAELAEEQMCSDETEQFIGAISAADWDRNCPTQVAVGDLIDRVRSGCVPSWVEQRLGHDVRIVWPKGPQRPRPMWWEQHADEEKAFESGRSAWRGRNAEQRRRERAADQLSYERWFRQVGTGATMGACQ